ncbi:hypothetical protein [Litoreibacter meonggei]|nr:hypothetical protein [Litoreibacter meonggei]
MQERVADYEQRALGYLKTTFPLHHQLHGNDTELALVRATYQTARRRGIKRIRDHLQYLGLTVYLGAGFERNPLHLHPVRRAGWLAPDGTAHRISNFDMLFAWAERWQELTALDCEEWPSQSLYDEVLRLGAWPDERAVYEALCTIWPNRTMAVPQPDLLDFIRETQAFAQSMALPQEETILWITAALQLGSRFAQDPRYQPLAAKLHPNSNAPRPTAKSIMADLKAAST